MNFNATSVKRGFGDLWMGLAIMQDFNRQDRERVLSGTVLVVPGGRRSDGSEAV